MSSPAAVGSESLDTGPVDRRATGTVRRAQVAGVVALLAFGLSVLTLIVLAVQNQQNPGVVSDSGYTIAAVGAALAALAGVAAVVGYLLRHSTWGRAWALLGLAMAVCSALLLALMWVPPA